jgi:ABC-type multidrug transport system permease subunit
MESLGNIWNLGVKELRSIWHDKVLLLFVLVAFTFMVYTAGSAGSMELHNAGGALPINLVSRVSFNPNLDGTWFGGVMELISMITMISIILTGAALIREREHGTVEHLMVMPVKPFEIMAAKVWANGLIVMLAATLSVTVVIQQVLAVPVQGSVLLFLLGVLIHLFSTTAIGILIGTVARTMPQSGGITPRESMPDLVQNIMLAAPTTHFVSMAQAILYRGAGLDVVWPQMLALVAIGVVFFSVALALFRRHLAV